MVGRSLLHYQILDKIGEGGMGVVYKARDTHLDRFVAIKTLPADRMADAERKRRFVQEAKAASALNHPNIVTIYDITSEQDVDFIAMEYIAGKSIEQMIPRQGMRLADALNYAVQIADGLSQAHQANIIHRDLKPGNIMVGEGGRVKILDFGLAKLTGPDEIAEDESTRTMRDGTEDGAVVGTASYMSPEQAEGRLLDARTDIFSFGIVLYEMLSGRKPFQGASRMATVSAILKESPKPLSGFVPEIPRELERLVERCLRKDRERRWQSMRDLRVALLDLKEESDSGTLAPVQGQKRPAAKWRPLAAAAVAALILTVGAALWWMSRTAVNPQKEVSVVPLTAQPGDERDPTFSPDGNQVAFAWGPEGARPDIYVKLIGPGAPIRLTNTPDDERMPQWSPDGRWIAFPRSGPSGQKVVVIPALGGPERVIAQDKGGNCVSWSADSQWILYTPAGGGLYLAPLNGGEKKFVIGPLQGKYPVYCGIQSPDSRKLAFISRIGLYVVPLSTNYKTEGEPKALTPADWTVISPAWTADGKEILFIRSAGDANAGSDTSMYRVAIAGGAPRRVDFAGDNPWYLGVAPRGNRMAFTRLRRDINIHRLELDADGAIHKPGQVIASSSRRDDAASYSPDGTRIAFSSNRGGSLEIWTALADGGNAAQLTTSTGMGSTAPQWSPDGSKIAYSNSGIFVIPASGGAVQALTTDSAGGSRPTWSRDGRWIYFQRSNGVDGTSISNMWKIASTGGPATQVTRGGGNFAVESPDRKWLYFSGPAGVLRRMPLEGGEEADYVRDLASARAGPIFLVTTNGVYYLGRNAGQPGALIRFIGHAGGESKTLGSILRPTSVGLSLSPDGRSLLYSQYDQSTAELMLVENFH